MVYLYCDGASRGNPGKASIGIAITKEKSSNLILEHSQVIGVTTNNVAEWTALKVGLEKVLELGERDVMVFMDSELVVRQVQGVYKVKDAKLKPIFQDVNLLKMKFDSFQIQHIPRELNSKADKLANLALSNAH